MTSSRFALYLVPPYPIVQQVAEIHALLRKQFGFIAADNFQVHCTIKGFFKKIEGPWEPLVEALDPLFKAQKPFEVEFNGYRVSDTSIVMDISHLGGNLNTELLTFRQRVVDLIRPYIAPNCDFVEADLGHPFRGHITLAFNDIPLDLQDHVLAFLKDAPLPTGTFTADRYHFLEFFSRDWNGPWWETLTWKLHKAWRLA